MEQKKWYKSKTIWAGIIAVGIAAYNGVSVELASQCDVVGSICVHLPAVPEWAFAILSAFGIYGRSTAKTEIK